MIVFGLLIMEQSHILKDYVLMLAILSQSLGFVILNVLMDGYATLIDMVWDGYETILYLDDGNINNIC